MQEVRTDVAVETPARWRFWAAWAIALSADAVQMALFPLFGEGFASPWNDALDVIVAAALIGLLGFHWALVPTFVAEALPLMDLAPTWTIAVGVITRARYIPGAKKP